MRFTLLNFFHFSFVVFSFLLLSSLLYTFQSNILPNQNVRLFRIQYPTHFQIPELFNLIQKWFQISDRKNFCIVVRDHEPRYLKKTKLFFLLLKLAPRLPLLPANTCTNKSFTYHRERRKTERKEGKKKAIVDVVRKQGIWSPFTRQQKKCVFFTYSYLMFRTLWGFFKPLCIGI
jgi:hypothetical protein